jgi:chromosome partitioning protein
MIISITSFKGGVGKTTSAVHIATALQKKKPTILVDGDPNESCLAWKERGDLPFEVIKQKDLLDNAKNFEYIIIDTPARPTTGELKIICSKSNLVIVPTQPDALSLDALLKLTNSFEKIGADNYKVLITLVPPLSHAGKEAKQLLKDLEIPFFNTEIQRRAITNKAPLNGVTVNTLKNGKEAWKEFSKLSKEILKYE